MEQEFISKDAIEKCFVLDYPKGTSVVVYCHAEDKDIVTKDVERKGYILAYIQEVDGYLENLIKRGTYIIMKEPKPIIQPIQRYNSCSMWLDNIT